MHTESAGIIDFVIVSFKDISSSSANIERSSSAPDFSNLFISKK